MTLTAEITFPLGRYHATPWNRHVNEGAVEWPPSPWRLTRALFAVWKDRLPHLDPEHVEEVLTQVAVAPTYHLPPWRSAATRHYYPANDHLAGVKTSTDKVIDAFVAIDPDEPLILHWEGAELSSEAGLVAQQLIEALPAIGRADSICTARVVDAPNPGERCTELRPTADGAFAIPVPVQPLVISDLTITTDQMRKARLRQPPGMRTVAYPKPDEATRLRHRESRPPAPAPNAAIYAVSGVPAPAHRLSVAVADLFRSAVQSKFERLTGTFPTPILSGHAPGSDAPSTAPHHHLHVLPLAAADGSGKVDRILAWAPDPDGFGPQESAALAAVTTLKLQRRSTANPDRGRPVVRGLGPTRVLLSGLGDASTLCPELTRSSTTWESISPFVPPRHPKARHRSDRSIGAYPDRFLTDAIERELANRGIDASVLAIQELSATERPEPASRYRRHRLRQSLGDARPGVWVRFSSDRPLDGPLAIGTLSHFGLGLFRPVDHE